MVSIQQSAFSYELLAHYRTEGGISLPGVKYVYFRIPQQKKKVIPIALVSYYVQKM
ncbi:MAG: hypothetical protein SWX82_19720 [Cyanobacteriota bacterium]|nr:hypothetical protein [Cyanobacteriota bacterium]